MGQAGLSSIALAFVVGTLARLYLLRVDYRQYPSYPQGYLTHLFLGGIAAGLGAVAIPALHTKSFEAVTFLALAAQQFREIRGMERDSLVAIESNELVPRGSAYIEGIAKIFETRNYVAMLAALITSSIMVLSRGAWLFRAVIAVAAACVAVLLLQFVMRGRRVKDYAKVREGRLVFDGPALLVDQIYLMNVGRAAARETILRYGLGAVIEPIDPNARVTLASIGQRQAIVHDVASILGIRRDLDEPEFTPIARMHHETGYIGLVVVPVAPDGEALVDAVERVPIIESVKRKPLAAKSGREAFSGRGRDH
jgi:hypothetical protein